MHFGATLRLLRLGTGLGLRDLARRVGVSGAYLSRVESGLDPVPTPERLAAIARELELPEGLLLDAAGGVSPLVLRYAEQEPQAAALFLELARRGLAPHELAQVRRYVESRFGSRRFDAERVPALASLLSPRRVILQLQTRAVEDAIELASVELAHGASAPAEVIAAGLRAACTPAAAVGGAVAILHARGPNPVLSAALVTLARPAQLESPDGVPVTVLLMLVGPRAGPGLLTVMAHAARLAQRGLADALADVHTPAAALRQVEALEEIR